MCGKRIEESSIGNNRDSSPRWLHQIREDLVKDRLHRHQRQPCLRAAQRARVARHTLLHHLFFRRRQVPRRSLHHLLERRRQTPPVVFINQTTTPSEQLPRAGSRFRGWSKNRGGIAFPNNANKTGESGGFTYRPIISIFLLVQ